MNCYEHTLIARQDLVESQNKELTDKYQKIIEDNSGKVLKIEKWGIKNLTHKIKNNQKGFYIPLGLRGKKYLNNIRLLIFDSIHIQGSPSPRRTLLFHHHFVGTCYR